MARLLILVVTLALAAACQRGEARPRTPGPEIVGEGATFPAPLYELWTLKHGAQTGTRVRYRATGSSRGIEALMLYRADFAGSEAPLTDHQLEDAGDVVHVPVSLAPVAIVYNAEGVPDGLNLTSDVLAAIFLAEIKRWDDPRIAFLNPGISLPPRPITVVYRRDGSGTTRVFTEYLSRVSPTFKKRVGIGTKVSWPMGIAADGNEGLSDFVWRAPGTIGYVSLTFARAKRLKVAAIGNKLGRYVLPSLDGAIAAARSALTKLPTDLRISLVDGDSEDSYPIVGLTYAIVRRDMEDREKAVALARFLWWAVHEGQAYAPGLHFAGLPPEIVARAEDQLRSLRADGRLALPPASAAGEAAQGTLSGRRDG